MEIPVSYTHLDVYKRQAPHGGIFVFPTVGNPFMYLVALAIGSVVSAVLLGVLKKNVA